MTGTDRQQRDTIEKAVNDALQCARHLGQQVSAVGYIARTLDGEVTAETSAMMVMRWKDKHFDAYVIAPRAEFAMLMMELEMWTETIAPWTAAIVLEEDMDGLIELEQRFCALGMAKLFDVKDMVLEEGETCGMRINKYAKYAGGGMPWHVSKDGTVSTWSRHDDERECPLQQEELGEQELERFLCEVVLDSQYQQVVSS